MKKISIFVLSVLFFTTATFAQKLAADQIFKENSEICFYFFIDENTNLDKISSIISIDKVEHDKALAYASKKEFEQFLSLEIPYYLQPSPSQLATGIVMNDNVDLDLLDEWDFYPTYEEYVELMFEFANLFPDLCEIIDFGTTTQGRQLLVAHINNDLTQQGEPQFLYTSTMHGDETAGFVMMLNLIDYLLSNYGAIDQVTELVNTLDIFINPNANPDGTYRGGNNTVQGATRYNANNVDLNRNYPDPEDGPHPDGNEWQPETLAFMALAEAHDFVMAANFHGGAEVVNYPFDTWPDLHADDLWWQFVSHEYADSCQTYSPTGYMSGFNDGITNGYAWYTTNGCRQDYMNYFHHCREATIEISNTKLVPASQLTQYWEYNRCSLLNFMQQALYGVHGQITDMNTSLPLNASVVIENHDLLESHVFSTETTGDYHRPIKAGTYDFTFQAAGYMPLTIYDVEAVDYSTVTVNAQLDPGTLTADFTADKTLIPVNTQVQFSDLSFGGPVSWEWTFEGGTPETSGEQNPLITYSEAGTFDVSLTVYDTDNNTHSITRENYISVSLEYLMATQTITTCGGIFYDSGGSNSNYSDNEDLTMIFYPGEENFVIQCSFLSFDVEEDANCEYDYLRIYNGDNTSAPLINTFCGNSSPGVITADNVSGALTFQFHSDYSVNKAGWIAEIECKDPLGITDFPLTTPALYPNPVTGNILSVNSYSPVTRVRIIDLTGREVYCKVDRNGKINAIDVTYLPKGVFMVSITDAENITVLRKIIRR